MSRRALNGMFVRTASPSALVGTFLCLFAGAQEPAKPVSKPALRDEITPELRLAVERGFRFLISKQHENGDFDSTIPVAANALTGLAFLAGGYSERAGGEHSEVVRRCTNALLRHQLESGYFEDGRSFMYGHGFATLYLAELFGTSEHRQEEIRKVLVKALRVIESSQGTKGGWDYSPARAYAAALRPFGNSDTSITVCQTMALRAARNLGLTIDAKVISRAKAYIEGAQNPDGGFMYREDYFGGAGRSSAFPRSAAGVCILYSLGNYNSEKIRKGFDYLDKYYSFPWTNYFPFYAHYYCSQAMFQAGGRRWNEYFRWISRNLIDYQQKSDGSWEPMSPRESRIQTTAMALIILQLPYRFLPIHER